MTESRLKQAYAEGRRALGQGDSARALAAFGQALAIDPEDPLSLQGAGIALMRLGRVRDAEALLRRALDAAKRLYGSQHPTVAAIEPHLAESARKLDRTGDTPFPRGRDETPGARA